MVPRCATSDTDGNEVVSQERLWLGFNWQSWNLVCFNLKVANLHHLTPIFLNVTACCESSSNFVMRRMYRFCRTPPQLKRLPRHLIRLHLCSLMCRNLDHMLVDGILMQSFQASIAPVKVWKMFCPKDDSVPNGFRQLLSIEDSFIPQSYTMRSVNRLSHSPFQPFPKALQQLVSITSRWSFQWNLHLSKTKTQSHHSLEFLLGLFVGALLRHPKRAKAPHLYDVSYLPKWPLSYVQVGIIPAFRAFYWANPVDKSLQAI